MNANEYFKTYYKIIMQSDIQQQDRQKTKNQYKNGQDTKEQEQPNEINMQQKFQDAKNDALNGGVQNCTKEIAKAAYTEINEAYKDNPGLFDEIKTETKSDQKTAKQKKSSITETTNTDSMASQSIKLSNKFNDFYNLVFEDQLIEEGKTQQVYSDHYMLIVNDDGTFKLVNDEDPDTKFSLDDYKHVNNWIQSNKQSWMDCVKKFGGRSYGIKDEELDELINNFKITDKQIDGKAIQRVKQVILNIKNNRHFKELTSLYKQIKKKEGYLDKTKKTEIKTIFFKTLIFIIAKTYNDAPNKQKRKDIAKAKQQKDEEKRKKEIEDNKINIFKAACQKFAQSHEDMYHNIANACDLDNDSEDMLWEEPYNMYTYDGKTVAAIFDINSQIDDDDKIANFESFLKGGYNNNNKGPYHPQDVALFLSPAAAIDTEDRDNTPDKGNRKYRALVNNFIDEVNNFMKKNDPTGKFKYAQANKITKWN